MRLAAPILATLACLVLSGCGVGDRLANVGKAPDFSPIQNPQAVPGYQPVSLPMPAPSAEVRQANSLWRRDARTFFKDNRAAQVGDLVTILISIDDKASVSNETQRTRGNSEDASLSHFLGLESKLKNVLPKAVDPTNLVAGTSNSKSDGKGTIDRAEKITLKVAAVVTQVLPNGALVIHGRQEVRINYEVRDLQIAGVVRTADIASDNTISYEKIAEARIAYGGRGQLTDVQQPRYGQQVYDILFPF